MIPAMFKNIYTQGKKKPGRTLLNMGLCLRVQLEMICVIL